MRTIITIALLTLTGCSPYATVCESTFPETWTPQTWQDSCDGPDLLDTPEDASYTITLETSTDGDEIDHATTWTQGHNPFTESTTGEDFEMLGGDVPDSACGGFNGLHDKRFMDEMAHGDRGGCSRTTDVDEGDGNGCWWFQVVPLDLYYEAEGYLDGYGGSMEFGLHKWQVLTVEVW